MDKEVFNKRKIIVWGNTIFTKEILSTLYESSQCEIYAITNLTAKNPVLEYSNQHGIKTFSFDKLDESAFHEIETINPDLSIVIAYGRIIPLNFLDLPKFGSINIHGSLLPDLRGATPVQTALLKGYKKTGVTLQKMVYQMDAGDILNKYEVQINIDDNAESLMRKLSKVTTDDLINFLNNLFSNKIIPIPQDESKATICKIKDFSREKGEIDWNDLSTNIHNKIRAFYPEPTAWLRFQNKVINFYSSKMTEVKSQSQPGEFILREKRFFVSTQDNDLEILELVLEGKKKMSGKDFANGYLRNSGELKV